ncbi:MAG TPA: fibronectin type III domain-containing protein, partial [Thermoplasmata archaeon]|nr:fibronectin type III domain-containing protein [Thermoplasmata archaeon]
VGWTNPPGSLVNDTLEVTTGCIGATWSASVGVVSQYVVGDLRPNSTYCVTVFAWNSSGAGPRSAPVEVATLPVLPDPPTNLTVTGVGATSGTLSWTLPIGAGALGLRNVTVFQGSQCGAWSTEFSLPQVVDSWTATDLTPGAAYAWAVALWNVSGEGPASSCVTATTLAAPEVPAPGSITGLTVASTSPTSATLTWSYGSPTDGAPPEDVSYYVVSVGPTCATPVRAVVVSSMPATVSGLAPGRPYCLSLAAYFLKGGVVSGGSVSRTTPALSIVSPAVPLFSPIAPTGTGVLLLGSLVVALVAVGLLVGRRRNRAEPGTRSPRDRPGESPAGGRNGTATSGRRRSPAHRGRSGSR